MFCPSVDPQRTCCSLCVDTSFAGLRCDKWVDIHMFDFLMTLRAKDNTHVFTTRDAILLLVKSNLGSHFQFVFVGLVVRTRLMTVLPERQHTLVLFFHITTQELKHVTLSKLYTATDASVQEQWCSDDASHHATAARVDIHFLL